MAILSMQGVSLSYGDRSILKDVSFGVEEGEIAGLIGDNGAGKTTIFRMIVGEAAPDGGAIFLKKDASVGYLPQEPEVSSDRTIYDEVLTVFDEALTAEREIARLSELMGESESGDDGRKLSRVMREYSRWQEVFELRGGYTYKNRIDEVLSGLGFTKADLRKSIPSLSGGEKSIVGLAKILLAEPDLLLLDEPANHLDIRATRWLEDYLLSYRGTVIVISHNRYLLDRLSDKIVELENGVTETYPGNYSYYSLEKKLKLAKAAKDYDLQQREINRLEKMVERLRGHGVKGIRQSKSKAKQLDKVVERAEKPVPEKKSIKLNLGDVTRSGEKVLEIEKLSMAYEGRHLFSDLSLSVSLGERVGIVGPNGSGKSTLLRIILDQERAISGKVEFGVKVKIGYYSQEHETLDPNSTPFAEIMRVKVMEDWQVYAFLGRFLFSREDADKKIELLSGGEKSRLQIAKLVLSGANLLLLDEPTNHLDIRSCEVLESALMSFPGTIITISHDRYFLDKIVDKILEVEDGKAMLYPGDFTYYQEKKRSLKEVGENHDSPLKKQASALKEVKRKANVTLSPRKLSPQPNKESLEDIEAKIYTLESEKEALERKMGDVTAAKEFVKLGELSRRLDELAEELKKEYLRWEEMALEEGAVRSNLTAESTKPGKPG